MDAPIPMLMRFIKWVDYKSSPEFMGSFWWENYPWILASTVSALGWIITMELIYG